MDTRTSPPRRSPVGWRAGVVSARQALTESALAWLQGRLSRAARAPPALTGLRSRKGALTSARRRAALCTSTGARAAAWPAGRPGRRRACATDTTTALGTRPRASPSSAARWSTPAPRRRSRATTAPRTCPTAPRAAGPRRRVRVSRAAARAFAFCKSALRAAGRLKPRRERRQGLPSARLSPRGRGPLSGRAFRTYVFCCQSRYSLLNTVTLNCHFPFCRIKFYLMKDWRQLSEVPGKPAPWQVGITLKSLLFLFPVGFLTEDNYAPGRAQPYTDFLPRFVREKSVCLFHGTFAACHVVKIFLVHAHWPEDAHGASLNGGARCPVCTGGACGLGLAADPPCFHPGFLLGPEDFYRRQRFPLYAVGVILCRDCQVNIPN